MKPTIDQTLYDRDLQLWCLEIAQLKARDFEQLDIDNLLQEIESLVRRDRREIKSRLGTLLEHLLKRIYVDSADDHRRWELTIKK